jgi:hypothetical protein
MTKCDVALQRSRLLLAITPAFVLLVAAANARASFAPAEVRVRIAHAAAQQVGITMGYDPSYVQLRYPGGDVERHTGVCADVVVRSLRAIGVDLQREVHEDMRGAFGKYPRMWGLRKPDANIDHRRVPNLMTFFARRGKSLALDAASFEAGDVVAWRLSNGLYHIGVIANARVADGTRPLVVHNIGRGAQEEDVLTAFTIIGHYRW